MNEDKFELRKTGDDPFFPHLNNPNIKPEAFDFYNSVFPKFLNFIIVGNQYI